MDWSPISKVPPSPAHARTCVFVLPSMSRPALRPAAVAPTVPNEQWKKGSFEVVMG
jgi:hypothetical protein